MVEKEKWEDIKYFSFSLYAFGRKWKNGQVENSFICLRKKWEDWKGFLYEFTLMLLLHNFFFLVVYKKKKYTKKTYGRLKLENEKGKQREGQMGNFPY